MPGCRSLRDLRRYQVQVQTLEAMLMRGSWCVSKPERASVMMMQGQGGGREGGGAEMRALGKLTGWDCSRGVNAAWQEGWRAQPAFQRYVFW